MSKFWQGRKVFVTGATGMIGSWLVKELLIQKASVVTLVRDADPQSELYRSGDIKKVVLVNGALEDFWSLERAINQYEIDTVFHLGAQALVGVAQRFPLGTFETNIRGTYNLLEACRIHKSFVKRIVVASSDKAYGEQQDLPYTEDMTLKGRYPYEVSKSCADMLAQAYYHSFKMPITIARCANVFGGGDLNWSRIVPGTIRSFLCGERPIVRSDGSFVRDYIYVKDVIHAYIQLAESIDNESRYEAIHGGDSVDTSAHPSGTADKLAKGSGLGTGAPAPEDRGTHGRKSVELQQVVGAAFNFSIEKPMTVLDMVSMIQKIMGCKDLNPDIKNVAEGEIRSQYLSAAKARNVLKWTPKFDVEKSLIETIGWYKTFFSLS